MKHLGIFLIIVGIVFSIRAYNLNTIVGTGGDSVGSGDYSIYVPRQEVHNIGLMDERRTQLMISCFTTLIGVILFGFGSTRSPSQSFSNDVRKCPFCAELVKPEARVCKHCGKELPELQPVLPSMISQKDFESAIKGCENILYDLGYKLVKKGDKWVIKEPLGGRVSIHEIDDLVEYANSKKIQHDQENRRAGVNPSKDALLFIKSNLHKYGIEWINEGRISDDFKFLIFGRPGQGRQVGIYDRESTVIRLEKYDQEIDGVEVLTKCAKSHAAEASFSNFKGDKGVCVKVENMLSLQRLLDWYFA